MEQSSGPVSTGEADARGPSQEAVRQTPRRSLHSVAEIERTRAADTVRDSERERERDVSRSPRRPEESRGYPENGTSSHQQWLTSKLAEHIPKVPKETQREIRSLMEKLVVKIGQLQRCNERRVKLEEIIKLIQDGRIPPGMPQSKLPYDSPLWDSIFDPKDVDVRHTFTPTVDGGVSFRDARVQIHRTYLSDQTKLELEVVKLQRASLRLETSRKAFIGRCNVFICGFTKPSHDLDLVGNSSDEEQDTKKSMVCLSTLKRMYADAVERVATTQVTKSKQIAREKDQAAKVQSRVVEAGPEEILRMAVNQEVDRRFGSRKNIQSDSLPNGVNYTRLASDTLISGALPGDVSPYFKPPFQPPKKVTSPAVRAGVPYSKNKGKGKSSGKGKGKGKSPMPNAPAAKGAKGKGKGSKTGTPIQYGGKGMPASAWKGRKTSGTKAAGGGKNKSGGKSGPKGKGKKGKV